MKKNSEQCSWNCFGCCCGSSGFWGVVMVALGGYWLAQSLGWISYDLPIWPVLLIVWGGYLLFRRFGK